MCMYYNDLKTYAKNKIKEYDIKLSEADMEYYPWLPLRYPKLKHSEQIDLILNGWKTSQKRDRYITFDEYQEKKEKLFEKREMFVQIYNNVDKYQKKNFL